MPITINHITYDPVTDLYSFNHLSKPSFDCLTQAEQIEYASQLESWSMNDPGDMKLIHLCDDARYG